MKYSYILLTTFLAVCVLIYFSSIKPSLSAPGKKKQNISLFILLAVFSFILRFVVSSLIEGFSTDITCFKAWSQMVYENGFSNFYLSDALTDYPPGYMYVLYIIGFIKHIFHLPYDSFAFTFLIKLPAIICDILTGFLIFKTLAKREKSYTLSCAALYLLNPAVIINSSAWGQVDSVYTVFVILFIYFLYENKFMLSCIFFTVGFLFKPQIIIFAPVIICFFLYKLVIKKEIKHILTQTAKSALICILLFFAAILPYCKNFNFIPVLSQYVSTISSYPYACVNAYNFFMLTGGNWADINTPFMFLTYSTWSWIFIILSTLATIYIFFRSDSKNIYFQLGAFIITAVYTFAAKMHERYAFPAMALLLLSFMYTKNKKFLTAYILMSITSFLSVSYILYADIAQGTTAAPECAATYIISAANIAIFVYICFILLKPHTYFTIKKPCFSLQKNETFEKNTRIDYIIMAIVTLIYSVLAFVNLGDTRAAQTHAFIPMGTYVNFEFDEEITDIKWYNGYLEDRQVGIYSSGSEIDLFDTDSVFAWHERALSETKQIEMYFYSDTDIIEISFMSYGKTVNPKNISCSDENVEILNLCDESHLVPDVISFKNSTYFDEVYHARTAYEYIHSLTPYENTHPPLGKLLISFGILIFGMTPFGWRFSGTFCGIIMLPLMYIFAKRMFKSRKIAIISLLCIALDFMHFTQTRIATIDVFVTLFIILMYYFMYKYTQMSFYSAPLSQTLVPLGLSGLFFALAVSSKWTGLYGGIGLCIIFFATIFKRIYEYLKITSSKTSSFEDRQKVASLKKNTLITLLFCIGVFVILPILVYGASYIPYLKAPNMSGIKSIIENQKSMFDYHSTLDATHPYSSFWYQWPFITRPVWYYTNNLSGTVRQSIAALGNPIIWWFGGCAMIYVCSRCFVKTHNSNYSYTNSNALFITVAFASQYVPWIGVTRCVFLYHYFPSVPFLILAICFCFSAYASRCEKKSNCRYITIAYISLCLILFLLFYPVLSGTGVNEIYLKSLRWFPTWYF